jgi:hypothetical protein
MKIEGVEIRLRVLFCLSYMNADDRPKFELDFAGFPVLDGQQIHVPQNVWLTISELLGGVARCASAGVKSKGLARRSSS